MKLFFPTMKIYFPTTKNYFPLYENFHTYYENFITQYGAFRASISNYYFINQSQVFFSEYLRHKTSLL